MAFKTVSFILVILQVANSQFYGIPASSVYPSFNYLYNSNYYYPPQTPSVYVPTFAPNPAPPIFVPSLAPNPAPPIFVPSLAPTLTPTYDISPKSPPKRSVATQNIRSSPPTATAYFLPAPTDKVKASVLSSEVQISPNTPKYTCPLCNGFADVPLNAKVPPPPPIGSSVLPGILDKIPTILEDLKIKDPCSCFSIDKSDMYEKHKFPKKLSFDQELLEGFLTGLGLK